MSILLSGDFHGNENGELNNLTRNFLIHYFGRKEFDDINYHIILGDACFFHPNMKKEKESFRILAKRPFPILCVLGEYDPILGMDNIPEVDIGIGEKVLLVNKADPFIAYLKRGKAYTIDGIRFLVLGGALTTQREYRVESGDLLYWDLEPRWKNEYWSEQEKQDLYKLLETESNFDCVLSHTGPCRINELVCREQRFDDEMPSVISESISDHRKTTSNARKLTDEVAFMNDEVDKKIQCRQWWCGHWHEKKYYYDEVMKRGYQYLYGGAMILEKQGADIVVNNSHENKYAIPQKRQA